MVGQYEEPSCPFCDKGSFRCLYIPGSWSQKRVVTGSLPGRKSVSKSRDVWLIKAGCRICGKSAEDVERELKQKRVT